MPFFRSLVETAGMEGDLGVRTWGHRSAGGTPSGVTTTVSSTRTPPCPGRYTPGSTVTTWPAASVASEVPSTPGASWMSRPTPCPVPCTKASPQPASSITARQAASTPATGAPARHRSHPGRLGGGDDLEHAALRPVEGTDPADGDGAGHVRVVAVDEGAEVDDHEVAALDPARAGLVVGAGAVGTGGDDGVEADVVGPPGCASRPSRTAASASSVGPASSCGSTAASASSAMAQAASMRATSPASFTARRSSTRPSVGTSVAGHELGRTRRCSAQVTCSASSPTRATPARRARSSSAARRASARRRGPPRRRPRRARRRPAPRSGRR